MSYTMYTPLNVWLDPASVTDVVAYIQTYLRDNPIYSEEEIEEQIHDYLIAHPELIGGVQSVNGKTGTVVLSASDINTENNVTIESVLASLSSQISSIAANVATNTANITSLTGRVSTAETDLSALKSNLNPLVRSINLYDSTASSEGLLNSSGNFVSNASWLTTDFLPVAGNESITFQADIITNATLNSVYYACYDENKTVVLNRQQIPITADKNAWTVTIPACSYVRFSWLKTQFDNIMVSETDYRQPYYTYYLTQADFAKANEIKRNCAYVVLKNDVLNVRTMYGASNDIILKFGKHNGNNLPDFWQLLTAPNSNVYVNEAITPATGILTMSTDWCAPFIVDAVNNADGDNQEDTFTGGAHVYNGNPTAECISLEYYINGRKTDRFEGLANNIEIRWTNAVQASNTIKSDGTGRVVLNETHRLIFDGIKWTNYVDVQALEDIKIKAYYGFQMSGVNSIYPNFRFIGGTNHGVYTNVGAHDSGGKLASTIIAYGTAHKLILNVDCAYGLGKRDYYSGTKGAFSVNNANKLYFYLIDNTNAPTLVAGDIVSARADYEFIPV